MSGNRVGGLKARATNLARNPNFYKEIGALGGQNGRGKNYRGGFAHPDANPAKSGALGGSRSKRGKSNATKEAKRRLDD